MLDFYQFLPAACKNWYSAFFIQSKFPFRTNLEIFIQFEAKFKILYQFFFFHTFFQCPESAHLFLNLSPTKFLIFSFFGHLLAIFTQIQGF